MTKTPALFSRCYYFFINPSNAKQFIAAPYQPGENALPKCLSASLCCHVALKRTLLNKISQHILIQIALTKSHSWKLLSIFGVLTWMRRKYKMPILHYMCTGGLKRGVMITNSVIKQLTHLISIYSVGTILPTTSQLALCWRNTFIRRLPMFAVPSALICTCVSSGYHHPFGKV